MLRRLLDDPTRSPRVAREALELCHFDPDTGDDLRPRPGRARGLRGRLLRLPAELRNQRDHRLLDRHAITRRPADASPARRSRSSPGSLPRAEQLERLLARAATPSSSSSGSTTCDERGLDAARRTRRALIDGAQRAAGLHLRRPRSRRLRRRAAPRLPDVSAARRRQRPRGSRTPATRVIRFRHDEPTGSRSFASYPRRLREGRRTMSFAVGSLVTARGREWVVLPESDRRPPRAAAARRHRRRDRRHPARARGRSSPATFARPTRRRSATTARPAAARRAAARVPLERRARSARFGAHRRRAAPLPARAAADGAASWTPSGC